MVQHDAAGHPSTASPPDGPIDFTPAVRDRYGRAHGTRRDALSRLVRRALRARFTTGARVASLAAGPMAIAPVIAMGLRHDDGSASLAAAPVMLVLALLFGFTLALIPNFVGAALLVAAGERKAQFRRRLVWAITGFLFGAAIGTAILADWPLKAPSSARSAACARSSRVISRNGPTVLSALSYTRPL